MAAGTEAAPLSRRGFIAGGFAGLTVLAAPGFRGAATANVSDVMILGAGLAGLTAALMLEEAGLKVVVLEGDNRVGGRVFTSNEDEIPGHPEYGASGIGGHYAGVRHMADRFGVPLVRERPRTDPRKGELMYHVKGTGVRPEDWGASPVNPFSDERRRTIPLHSFQFLAAAEVENPLPIGDLEAWQNGTYGDYDISCYDFLKRRGVADPAIELGAGTNMSYGTVARDLSVLMAMQSRNLIRSLYDGDGTFDRIPRAGDGGNQCIPEAMAGGLKSDILLGRHVTGIRSTREGVEAHTRNGRVYRARYCICTLPFSALRLVRIDPCLEGLQAEAVQSLGYTPVFQAHFAPIRKYWAMDGLPPSMWTDRSPGRFMALKNDPSNPDAVTSCMAFVNGAMALYLDRLDPDDAAALILIDLGQMRPSTVGALKLLKTLSWNRNPFAGGAYAYWKPGQITRFSKRMRAPWHRIHFAGEHTAVLNRGMEGAMESGERAAFEVMDRL
ncbi:flavin monoamine oxidase family protein [Eilatimonas milleporae]|uniref:Tryptophan 2-monooxygenase n=1 Tax=Eilatimonas milleporae TaxID=911205 RepID=A0A3M0CKS2_9PROT|nr:NAD(P)/FAD-dependent oxidoreductase [Eilatimonas milleporae]RMB07626.1 monoamine oxidase [Eilatimonas milleporae]